MVILTEVRALNTTHSVCCRFIYKLIISASKFEHLGWDLVLRDFAYPEFDNEISYPQTIKQLGYVLIYYCDSIREIFWSASNNNSKMYMRKLWIILYWPKVSCS